MANHSKLPEDTTAPKSSKSLEGMSTTRGGHDFGDTTIGPDVWKAYIEQTAKDDEETFRVWQSDMDTLLIFAALFSAVLTAFVIESYPTLQQDSSDLSAAILLQILINMQGNSSAASAVPTDALVLFQPSPSSIRVNSLWFSSLILGLATSFLAILAKQWIHNLGADLSPLPVTGGRQRQHRYENWHTWRLSAMLSFLPVLLHIALLLFFAGLLDFLWQINPIVATVASILVTATVLIYSITNLLSIILPACPYQTSLTHVVSGSAAVALQVTLELYGVGALFFVQLLHHARLLWRHSRHTDTQEGLTKLRKDLKRTVNKIRALPTTTYMRSLPYLVPAGIEERTIAPRRINLECGALIRMVERSTRFEDVTILVIGLSRCQSLLPYRPQLLDAGIMSMLLRHLDSLAVYNGVALTFVHEEDASRCIDLLVHLLTDTNDHVRIPDHRRYTHNLQLSAAATMVYHDFAFIYEHIRLGILDNIRNVHLRANILRLLIAGVHGLNDIRWHDLCSAVDHFCAMLLHTPKVLTSLPESHCMGILNTVVYFGLHHWDWIAAHSTDWHGRDQNLSAADRSLDILVQFMLERTPQNLTFATLRQVCWGIYGLSDRKILPDPKGSISPVALIPHLTDSGPLSGFMALLSCSQEPKLLYAVLIAVENILWLPKPTYDDDLHKFSINLAHKYVLFVTDFATDLHSNKLVDVDADIILRIVVRLVRISCFLVFYGLSDNAVAAPLSLAKPFPTLPATLQILLYLSAHALDHQFRARRVWIHKFVYSSISSIASTQLVFYQDPVRMWTSQARKSVLGPEPDEFLYDNADLQAAISTFADVLQSFQMWTLSHHQQDWHLESDGNPSLNVDILCTLLCILRDTFHTPSHPEEDFRSENTHRDGDGDRLTIQGSTSHPGNNENGSLHTRTNRSKVQSVFVLDENIRAIRQGFIGQGIIAVLSSLLHAGNKKIKIHVNGALDAISAHTFLYGEASKRLSGVVQNTRRASPALQWESERKRRLQDHDTGYTDMEWIQDIGVGIYSQWGDSPSSGLALATRNLQRVLEQDGYAPVPLEIHVEDTDGAGGIAKPSSQSSPSNRPALRVDIPAQQTLQVPRAYAYEHILLRGGSPGVTPHSPLWTEGHSSYISANPGDEDVWNPRQTHYFVNQGGIIHDALFQSSVSHNSTSSIWRSALTSGSRSPQHHYIDDNLDGTSYGQQSRNLQYVEDAQSVDASSSVSRRLPTESPVDTYSQSADTSQRLTGWFSGAAVGINNGGQRNITLRPLEEIPLTGLRTPHHSRLGPTILSTAVLDQSLTFSHSNAEPSGRQQPRLSIQIPSDSYSRSESRSFIENSYSDSFVWRDDSRGLSGSREAYQYQVDTLEHSALPSSLEPVRNSAQVNSHNAPAVVSPHDMVEDYMSDGHGSRARAHPYWLPSHSNTVVGPAYNIDSPGAQQPYPDYPVHYPPGPAQDEFPTEDRFSREHRYDHGLFNHNYLAPTFDTRDHYENRGDTSPRPKRRRRRRKQRRESSAAVEQAGYSVETRAPVGSSSQPASGSHVPLGSHWQRWHTDAWRQSQSPTDPPDHMHSSHFDGYHEGTTGEHYEPPASEPYHLHPGELHTDERDFSHSPPVPAPMESEQTADIHEEENEGEGEFTLILPPSNDRHHNNPERLSLDVADILHGPIDISRDTSGRAPEGAASHVWDILDLAEPDVPASGSVNDEARHDDGAAHDASHDMFVAQTDLYGVSAVKVPQLDEGEQELRDHIEDGPWPLVDDRSPKLLNAQEVV